jgi:hypothetical protein
VRLPCVLVLAFQKDAHASKCLDMVPAERGGGASRRVGEEESKLFLKGLVLLASAKAASSSSRAGMSVSGTNWPPKGRKAACGRGHEGTPFRRFAPPGRGLSGGECRRRIGGIARPDLLRNVAMASLFHASTMANRVAEERSFSRERAPPAVQVHRPASARRGPPRFSGRVLRRGCRASKRALFRSSSQSNRFSVPPVRPLGVRRKNRRLRKAHAAAWSPHPHARWLDGLQVATEPPAGRLPPEY